MSTLFNNNNSESGYRLRYMEVYNWGTFHGKVYKLQTDGRTSLLTGANGSGKTTLIDALLTLLIPSNKRFYNQSSGAEFKKERDENSYFWGYFGKTFSELDEKSKTEQLRNKTDNPYSVLLACFQNSGTLHTISLVQARWFSGGALKKVFIVSPYQLNINDHFGRDHFDIKGDWKKKLIKQFPKTDLCDSFKDYAARFSELFGLKEKALSLFNQTVGIKVLGDLTQFIRYQMLEEPDTEEQFKNLYDHYIDLLISHKAIRKDEKQLELLEPIIKNKEDLLQLDEELTALRFVQNQLAFFLDKIEDDLLSAQISKLEVEIGFASAELIEIARSIKQAEIEQTQLIAQRAALNIDTQVQLLSKDIFAEEEKRNFKKENYTNYILLAKRLGIETEFEETSFKQNYLKIEKHQTSDNKEYEDLTYERFQYKSQQQHILDEIGKVQKNIDSFLSRKKKSRIPDDLIGVRERLLDLLETGEDELPFVGELVKIKEEASHWENAIQRLLHSFSLRLLVPEKYNKQVNQFVHSNNLQTRLVYERIERRRRELLGKFARDNDSLLNKIDIKDAGIYSDWLEQQLSERYDYYCTDDLETFYGCQKAITSNGLFRNVNRHEKDDRPNRWDKLKYTLGWDNKETVQLLQQEKLKLENQHKTLFEKLQEIIPKIKTIEDKRPLLTLIAQVKSFTEINWQAHAQKVEILQRQIEQLKKSSDKYKAICAQLDEIEKSLSKQRSSEKEIIAKKATLEQDLKLKQSRKLQVRFDELNNEGIIAIKNFISNEELSLVEPGTIPELESFKKELYKLAKFSHETLGNNLSKKQMETVAYISSFVHPNETILKDFPDWSGDVMNINSSLENLNELEDLYKTIRNQRLVEHKRRFREYMDKSMLDALTNFRAWLSNEEDRIKEIIEELNLPLKKITFNKNPDTYLQLECRATREQEIKIFKEQLSATIPNTIEFATQKDEGYREEVFGKIKDLITELQEEEVWRRKVTDVRNWLTFNAREYSVAENKAGQYHDNTASYSGGQKAQFTYAILGAAIAHQFGIFQPGKQYKSLRFITVDEAFSKLDPEKSQFLMEFCDQLNLQILVVTPLDKINIAEPYIHAVHFVEIKNKKNSIVYNLSMEEYYERKEEFKQLAENIE